MSESWADLGAPAPKAPAPTKGASWADLGKPSAPAPSYPARSQFASIADKAFGAGKWKETSGYRDPAHNAAVGGIPGSHHTKGSPDAPGAYDIVVPGMAPAAVAARLKAAGWQGSQFPEADHDHTNAPESWASLGSPPKAESWSDLGKAKAPAAAPKPPAAPAETGPPTIGEAISRRFNEGVQGAEAGFKKMGTTQPKGGLDALGTMAGIAGDEMHAMLSPFGGTAEALVARLPRGKSTGGSEAKTPEARTRDAKLVSANESGRAAGDAAEFLAPVGEAAALVGKGVKAAKGVAAWADLGKVVEKPAVKAAKPLAAAREEDVLTAPTSRRPRREAPPPKPPGSPAEHAPHDVVGNETNPIERVDNAFYRAGGRATAGKLEAKEALRAVPKEIRDEKVQEELTHAIEQKLIDPSAEIPEHLRAAEEARQPWAERQRAAINERNQILEEMGISKEEFAEHEPSDVTGYVPRNVVGRSRGFDRSDPYSESRNALGSGKTGDKGPFEALKDKLTGAKTPTGSKGSPLSTFSKSQRARTQMVWHNPATGDRTLIPSEDGVRAGDTKDGPFGVELTAKPATIKEVEANTDIRYHKNALANTIDRALHDERVLDNLKVLRETTRQMEEEGLASRTHRYFRGEDGMMNKVPANGKPPEGYKPIHGVPALDGWVFDPKLHQLLTDVLPKKEDTFLDTIGAVNRAVNASLFITPFAHIKNVGTMGFVGRGWDNFNPLAYPRLVRTSGQAIKEVLAMGPKYRSWLREGAGIQAGDDATRNFHQSMLDMFSNQVNKEPGIAKAFGVSPVELVKGLYKASHTALWNVNDMIMFQRYLELQERGMNPRAAIKETERWIANYRIPPEVMGSRFFKEVLSNGVMVNFGRYEHGKLKAMGEMVKDLTRGTGAEKLDAVGKAASLAFLGVFVYPLMNYIAKKATGDENSYVTPGGQLNMAESAANLAAGGVDEAMQAAGVETDGPYTFTPREKSWADNLAGFVTPSPFIETTTDMYGGKWGTGTTAGKAKYLAGKVYPLEVAEKAGEQGPRAAAGELLGINTPKSDKTPANQYDIPAAVIRAYQKQRMAQP